MLRAIKQLLMTDKHPGKIFRDLEIKFAGLNVKFKCRLSIANTFLAATQQKHENYYSGKQRC